MGTGSSPAEESTAIACCSRWCDCRSRQPARDAPGRGPREAAAAERLAVESSNRVRDPYARECLNLRLGIGAAMALVSMNLRPQNLRRGSRTFAHDQVRRGWSQIITIIQWVLIFEQSVNHRREPRWCPANWRGCDVAANTMYRNVAPLPGRTFEGT